MSQYKHLFNSTRIPKLGKDILYHDSTEKHILVMKGGRIYTFDVIDKNGKILITYFEFYLVNYSLSVCFKISN